jgi:hypothetical protein
MSGQTPMWTQFILGSNVISNCSGVLIADGRELFYLERGERDDQLLLSVDVFQESGVRVAKLRRNAWAFHQDHYSVTTPPSGLTLAESGGGRVLLSAKVHGRDRVEVDHGWIYTAEGMRVDITPESVVVDGRIKLSGNTISGMNSAIVIDKGSLCDRCWTRRTTDAVAC